MPARRRTAAALAVTGVLALAASLALAGPEPRALARAALALQLSLALLAFAGAALDPGPVMARLGLGRSRLPWSRLLLLVAGTLALSTGLDNLIDSADLRRDSGLQEIERTIAATPAESAWLMLLAVGFAPAVAEELLCRGLLQRGLVTHLGPVAGVGLASLFFGALHLDAVHSAAACVLGLYLGLAAWRADSTRAAILCHAANNLVALGTLASLPVAAWGVGGALAGLALAVLCLWAAGRPWDPAASDGPAPPSGPEAPLAPR